MGQGFSAPHGSQTKLSTIVVCLLLAGVTLFLQSLLFGVIAAVIIAVCYAYSPRGYSVAPDAIVVRRLIGSVTIPLAGLREARLAEAADFRFCLRLWGSGGLFGSFGLFRTSRLGNCWWYLTDRKRAVVVVTGQKTTLFSPDDPKAFLAAIGAVSVPSVGAPQPRADVWLLTAMGGVVGVLSLGLAVLAVTYSPGLPRYELSAEALVIDDRFYPVTLAANAVDLDSARAVNITGDSEWRPKLRTNGFANSHYRSGWFRVANGQTVRLYAAGGSHLVMLPAKNGGPAVLLEVAAPEEFLRTLRSSWN